MSSLFLQVKYFAQFCEQSFPPKPQFSTDQIPDLSGRVVIVTGASFFLTTYAHILASNHFKQGPLRV